MRKHINFRANIALGLLFAFWANDLGPIPTAQAQEFKLPAPGQMVFLSPAYSPALLKGIKIDPKNPFNFHFYLDKGKRGRAPISPFSQEQLKEESSKLIKYFLASLTIPEKDLWVNLSPYEKDRIIPQEFGQTEMGRDLLAQDYILKQLTASLIYPESKLGKEFWTKIYAQAQAKYGTTNIPINTFNKVWIIPDKAVVYENNGTAFVLENHLKVMLEEDYLSRKKGTSSYFPFYLKNASLYATENTVASNIIRDIVIPALTKEVNEGKNFAQLRQVFYSLILATWYKKKIKDSILNQIYSDRKKIKGVGYDKSPLKEDPESIYQQYLKAFKKGVFNYIKEDAISFPGWQGKEQGISPKKYFSGGCTAAEVWKIIDIKERPQVNPAQLTNMAKNTDMLDLNVNLNFAMYIEPKDLDDIFASTIEGTKLGQGIKSFYADIREMEDATVLSFKITFKAPAQHEFEIQSRIDFEKGEVKKLITINLAPEKSLPKEYSQPLYAAILCTLNKVYQRYKNDEKANLKTLQSFIISMESVQFFNNLVDRWIQDGTSPQIIKKIKLEDNQGIVNSFITFDLSLFDWAKIEKTFKDSTANEAMRAMADLKAEEYLASEVVKRFPTLPLDDMNLILEGLKFRFNSAYTKFDKFDRIGPLFFLSPDTLKELELKKKVADIENIRNKMDQEIKSYKRVLGGLYQKYPHNFLITSSVTLELPTTINVYNESFIAGMLKNAPQIRGKTFIDLGAGSGILSLVALALGASKVVLVEEDEFDTKMARLILEANGYKPGKDFYIIPKRINLMNQQGIVDVINGIEPEMDNRVLGMNMGPWTDYKDGFTIGHQIMNDLKPALIIEVGYNLDYSKHRQHASSTARSFEVMGYQTERCLVIGKHIAQKLSGHRVTVPISIVIMAHKPTEKITSTPSNPAQLAKITREGGINLNPAQMGLTIKNGSPTKAFADNDTFININPAQVIGIAFTINSMKPVANFSQLLGLK